MNFLENIFGQLETAGTTQVLVELREGGSVSVTGQELLERIAKARAFLAGKNLMKGDRCALLAPNSIDWVAMDLAIMAEGLLVVPLYSRQAPAELVAMMKDCSPALICCANEELRDGIVHNWPEAPAQHLFEEIFTAEAAVPSSPPFQDSDPVAVIYTSGTSGEA